MRSPRLYTAEVILPITYNAVSSQALELLRLRNDRLFVSVPKTVECRLIEAPSNELQPYRKP